MENAENVELAAVVAELLFHRVRDSEVEESRLLMYLEAYHKARMIDRASEQPVTPGSLPPVEPPAAQEKKTSPLARKKQRILAELESRKARGLGMQDIVDASGGAVSLSDVLCALGGGMLPVATWDAMAKALKAAKGGAADVGTA